MSPWAPRTRTGAPNRSFAVTGNCVEAPARTSTFWIVPRTAPMPDFTYADIAKRIDHSLLQPVLTDAELEKGCRLAREYQVASVCIKPYAVAMAAGVLAGSGVAVGTVIGFPHGGHLTRIKRAEAEGAMDDGAVELDMVVNIGKAWTVDRKFVSRDTV